MNTKPRILFVLHLPPPVHGAAMVGKCIHDSERVNRAFSCHYVNLTTAQNLEDIGKGGLKKLKAFVRKLMEIRKVIKSTKPDAVYVTPNSAGGPFYKDFVVVQLCKWWSKRKVILHFHNKGVSTRQDRWLDDRLYRWFFRNAEVILLGKPLYDDIKRYVKEEQVHYCPNGIPDSGYVYTERTNEVPHILWLTNIMLTKGLMEYLDALAILKKQGVRFEADFVGGATVEVSEAQFRSVLRERRLEDCTHYAGRKYGQEKEAFFCQADMFVLPSYTEAFPLTILEAMQHGLPVVATNVGGVSIAVEQGVNGLLVGGYKPIMSLAYRPDAQELADNLKILLIDKGLRTKMGLAGLKKYQSNLTLQCFEERFVEAIYHCLLN